MKNLRSVFLIFSASLGALSIASLVQTLSSAGLSGLFAEAIEYYRIVTLPIFYWFTLIPSFGVLGPEGLPYWYQDAWVGSAFLIFAFVRAYQIRGGRIALLDIPMLFIASFTLMGFVLTAGGAARFISHLANGNSDGLREERWFVFIVAGGFTAVLLIILVNAGLANLGL